MISGDGARLESRSKQAKAKAALSIKECCSISQRERERERERNVSIVPHVRTSLFHFSSRIQICRPLCPCLPRLLTPSRSARDLEGGILMPAIQSSAGMKWTSAIVHVDSRILGEAGRRDQE